MCSAQGTAGAGNGKRWAGEAAGKECDCLGTEQNHRSDQTPSRESVKQDGCEARTPAGRLASHVPGGQRGRADSRGSWSDTSRGVRAGEPGRGRLWAPVGPLPP